MPIYCYTTNEGETIERQFSFQKTVPEQIRVMGKTARRDRQAEGAPRCFVKGSRTPVKQGLGKWPMEPCVASGVNASQAQELRDYLANRGCPTEVSKDGDPIYISAAHRRKALKLRGMHDNSSYD